MDGAAPISAQATAWQFFARRRGSRAGRLERWEGLPEPRIEWARNLALPELARRLAACSRSWDTIPGIKHLATAVGLPGLVLWGESVAGLASTQ